MTEAEMREMQLQAQECQGLPDTTEAGRSLLDPRPLASRAGQGYISIVKPPNVWYFVTAAPGHKCKRFPVPVSHRPEAAVEKGLVFCPKPGSKLLSTREWWGCPQV